MPFIPEALDTYVVNHTEKEPELLQQLTQETYQKILQLLILSRHDQSRALSTLSKLIHHKNNVYIRIYIYKKFQSFFI